MIESMFLLCLKKQCNDSIALIFLMFMPFFGNRKIFPKTRERINNFHECETYSVYHTSGFYLHFDRENNILIEDNFGPSVIKISSDLQVIKFVTAISGGKFFITIFRNMKDPLTLFCLKLLFEWPHTKQLASCRQSQAYICRKTDSVGRQVRKQKR